MKSYTLPSDTHIGHVRLQVADLNRALAFYHDLLGFPIQGRRDGEARLSANGEPPAHIILFEHKGAPPKPPRTTGLYHVAIRLPDRLALGRIFLRLVQERWPLQGAADHLVSEALYLADPDGNGLELYRDRPRQDWPRQNGAIAMASDPLDANGLLKQASQEPSGWSGIDPRTDIGHVHLHVSDLGRAEEFYSGLLGLDVTQRSYPGALFMSAGGYHHHLGVNTWAGRGAPPPPPDAAGLISFSLDLPDPDAREALMARLQKADAIKDAPAGKAGNGRAIVQDADGNRVEI
jgi:catechol 2,3-dioxygenase